MAAQLLATGDTAEVLSKSEKLDCLLELDVDFEDSSRDTPFKTPDASLSGGRDLSKTEARGDGDPMQNSRVLSDADFT